MSYCLSNFSKNSIPWYEKCMPPSLAWHPKKIRYYDDRIRIGYPAVGPMGTCLIASYNPLRCVSTRRMTRQRKSLFPLPHSSTRRQQPIRACALDILYYSKRKSPPSSFDRVRVSPQSWQFLVFAAPFSLRCARA